MFFNTARRRQSKAVETLYRKLVDISRRPEFYARLGVADSIEGRFEMLVLHCGLVVAELDKSDSDMKACGLALAEGFFADMDRSLREIGITDIGVPKKMKKLAEAFYGRLSSYQDALNNGDRAKLAAAVERNIYSGTAGEALTMAMAGYIEASAASLAMADKELVLSGAFIWPEPPAVGEGAS